MSMKLYACQENFKIFTIVLFQVESSERVIVYGPEYLTNLTTILAQEPKRNIANYMLWKVALSTLGYMDKSSRELTHQFAKDVSGKTDRCDFSRETIGLSPGGSMGVPSCSCT